MEKGKTYIGIDISKDSFDIAVHPSGQKGSFTNNEKGITEAVSFISSLSPESIIVESTGGFETDLALAFTEADLPVAVINPRQVRDYAKAMGILAKTDTLDAQVIASFAAAVNPTIRPMPGEEARELKSTMARRRQIIEMITPRRTEAISLKVL